MKSLKATLALSLLLLSSQPSFAETKDKRFYLQGLAGPAFLAEGTSDKKQILTYGARAGLGVFQLKDGIFSLGVAAHRLSDSQTVSGIAMTHTFTSILLDAFSRRLWNTGLYGGARFGIAFTTLSASAGGNSTSASGSSLSLAPAIGYELNLGPFIGFGVDLSYLTRSAVPLTFSNIGTFTLESMSYFLAQGTFAFHF